MNWGKSLFSPVNYGQHVNPNLMSSSTVSSVYEHNRCASSIGNQDLQSVVDTVAFMNRGVSNGNLVASEPVGIIIDKQKPKFSKQKKWLQWLACLSNSNYFIKP